MAVFLRDQRFLLSTPNREVWHFTESQNHRTAEVTEELGRSSCSKPLLMQGPRAGQPQTLFRQLLSISKDRDSKNSQSNLCWHTPSSFQCFLKFKGNLLCFSLWPLTLVTGHIWKEPDSAVFVPSFQVFTHIYKMLLSLILSRRNSHSCLSLKSYERGSNSFIILVTFWWIFSCSSISLLDWETQNRIQHCRCSFTSAEREYLYFT